MPPDTGISSGMMGHLARMQTLLDNSNFHDMKFVTLFFATSHEKEAISLQVCHKRYVR